MSVYGSECVCVLWPECRPLNSNVETDSSVQQRLRAFGDERGLK